MSIQSNVQQLLQASSGLQTEAQANVPSGVNNGNPNSVYNWSSYIPSILRNSAGTPTGANFDLITSQPQASAPGTGWNTGYTPPFAADPFAAMLMSQLSQYRGPSASQLPGYGAGNPMIDNILRNLIGGYVSSPAPGTGAPGTTTPPGAGTPGTGTPSPGTGAPVVTQPGTGTPVGTTGPNSGGGIPVQWSDYNASPIVGGGGNVGAVGSGIIGGSGGSLPSGTGSYTPNYGNFDNTGAVGPIWGNDAYGNDFSTGGTGAPANQGGGFMGAIRGAIDGVVPSNGTTGGFFSDLLHTLGIRTGATTGNVADMAATAGSMGAALIPGAIQDAGAGFINGWRGGPVSIDMANGSANNFGFGDVSGGWNVGDAYAPNPIVNPDFSLGNVPQPNVGDINAYLEQMRANETAPGTAPATQPTTPTTAPVNANGRTAEQEAAYRAGLDMQSNLAAQRYGSDINMGNLPVAPRER